MLTQEEFHSWKTDPTTRKVVKIIQEQRQILADSLVNGVTLKGEAGATTEETAKQVGILYGIDLFLEFEVIDEKEEKKDDEQK